MNANKYDRRKFLGAVTAGATGAVLVNSIPAAASARTNSAPFESETKSEYFFDGGLTYLNTGTLGPCRRETVQGSMRDWEALEEFPVKFYGKFGAESLAEKTRAIAARFMGCDIGEMLITTSTTNGMNALAQGLRLKSGERIMVTDQEHGRG